MKAAVLIKNGDPRQAFQLQELPDLQAKAGEVRIAVIAFGLNFADVMARQGLYRDCPPLPTIIGYEVVGIVDQLGEGVTNVQVGQRVVAFTRFGAYATQAVTKATAVVPVSDKISDGEATALATQYCTAYYAAAYVTQLHEQEHVLIHACAGGVGTALVQLAKQKKCIIYGTAGSAEKLDYLHTLGVDYPINYQEEDFEAVIKQIAPQGKVDVIFDPIGGKSVKKGVGLLNAGGRIICYGASSMSGRKKSLFKSLNVAVGFGFYNPIAFIMNSKSLIGVNMLRIADNKPLVIQHCLQKVVELTEQGILKPTIGGKYPIAQLVEAQEHLEFRKSIGKLVVSW